MGSAEVAKILPGSQFLVQIHIIGIRQQLVELFLICSMGSFYLTIQLRSSGFNVYVLDALVLRMPMELGLPLMSAVGPYGMDSEWELFNDVVNKINCAALIMLGINFQCPDPGGIVNGRILKATYLLAFLGSKGQELDVNLDLVSGNLLGIAVRMKSATADVSREGTNAISF